MYIPNFGFESFEWVGLIVCRRDMAFDENRDSPERDMVNPYSEDSYMWPIRGAL